MKKIFLILSMLMATSAFSQVAIGKKSISSPAVSLEFYDGADNKRGIILPWVTSLGVVNGAVNGTFVYNAADNKVYVKYASGWKDLSIDSTGVVDTSLQNSLSDVNQAKVLIGGDYNTDITPGILVLGDHHTAMILPKVTSPHMNIINPSPGMMAYDTTTKQLAIFNGTVWTFWKP